MLAWLAALVAGAAFAYGQYRLAGLPNAWRLQALRGGAVAAIVALLLNAPIGWRSAPRAYAALDASASWRSAGDSAAWAKAVQAAARAGADTTLLFGDSVRAGKPPAMPGDVGSHVTPLVERALGAGRSVVVVTDGRIDDPERLEDLPSGSSVQLVDVTPSRDAALASLQGPAAAVTGDSVEYVAVVAAGGAGAPAAKVELALDGTSIGVTAIDSMAPYAEREVRWRTPAGSKAGQRLVRVTVAAPGDKLTANDTLFATLDVAAGAAAVFASTAPDFDARYALDVLRGTLAVPTRGFYRVAPGQWRVDGTLTAVPEDEVKKNLAEAPIVVIHGDTAVFGAPRGYAKGALALVAPPVAKGDEYYPVAAPPSPLMGVFSTLPWDSLPPIDVGEGPRVADWTALTARRGRRLDERKVMYGVQGAARTVVIPAAGLWRWRFRGGRNADTFVSVWGAVFDYLAGETSDARGARPASAWFREGEPIRWRRGGMRDSAVTAVLRRRGAQRPDTVRLRFPGGSAFAESPSLAAGVYTTQVAGAEGLLTVNASAEWLPRRPTVHAGAIGTAAPAGRAPSSRAAWWLYALAIAAICAEWILRRRIGLR